MIPSWATDDINEMTNPTFPQLRAVDALDPRDPAFPLILNGGVTTSQLMPGSGTAMGGEGVIVKNRGRTIQDMLLPNAPRLL
jgi:imidazolonepropionase-like amidohydrolase